MTTKRKRVLEEIERQKKAYYEHLEKARNYAHPQDKEYAMKTADRIRRQIEKLAASIGERVEL